MLYSKYFKVSPQSNIKTLSVDFISLHKEFFPYIVIDREGYNEQNNATIVIMPFEECFSFLRYESSRQEDFPPFGYHDTGHTDRLTATP